MNFLLVLAACGFLVAVSAGVWAENLPLWTIAVYGTASVVTFLAYGWDKHRARSLKRRTRERTLHLLELAGGWPGALIAQRLLRHKNWKPTYQFVFWMIVALHILGWIAWLVWRSQQ